MGNSLKGFYMVRFTNKRIKSIYCEFDAKMNENTFAISETTISSINNIQSASSDEISQFCNDAVNQPCKFLYPDYPDIPLFDSKSKKVSRNATNCEDLSLIGYSLKGFYLVYLCKNKVKIIYCDFDVVTKKDRIEVGTKTLVSKHDISKPSSEVLPSCNAVGSQPCSCHYSNFPDIIQFELSNDEATLSASSENGTGPQNCEGLKNIGYTLDGFYLVRFKTNIIQTVYCVFNYSEQEENRPVTTTQPPSKPAARSKIFSKNCKQMNAQHVKIKDWVHQNSEVIASCLNQYVENLDLLPIFRTQ